MKVIFTARAQRHVVRLHNYITEKAGGRVADAYAARIVSFCQGLRTFPLRGQKRDDLLPGLRTIGFERRITIAFVVEEKKVVIEGIFYGGQDFEAAFRA